MLNKMWRVQRVPALSAKDGDAGEVPADSARTKNVRLPDPRPSDFIDVREMLQNSRPRWTNSIATRRAYYRHIADPDLSSWRSPLRSVHETPELLTCFAQTLMGLKFGTGNDSSRFRWRAPAGPVIV